MFVDSGTVSLFCKNLSSFLTLTHILESLLGSLILFKSVRRSWNQKVGGNLSYIIQAASVTCKSIVAAMAMLHPVSTRYTISFAWARNHHLSLRMTDEPTGIKTFWEQGQYHFHSVSPKPSLESCTWYLLNKNKYLYNLTEGIAWFLDIKRISWFA